jgi:probable rRNA maturation factor
MESLERDLLAELGYPDPYDGDDQPESLVTTSEGR